MCALLRYSAAGLAGLLTTAYVAVSAESGGSAFRPMVIEPAPGAQTLVNRVNKTDRGVPLQGARAPVTVQSTPTMGAKEPKILEGCDPAFSPLMASAKNNFANRCLA